MPTFKLTIPSTKTESGIEVTRWNPRLPDEKITLELLVKRLRQIIHTPTTGYDITWNDGVDTCTIRTTEDLHEAIQYFTQNESRTDKCVRLRATPKDTLDLFTALEVLSDELQSDLVPPESEEPSDPTMGFQLVDLDDRMEQSQPPESKNQEPEVSNLKLQTYERERQRDILARLRIEHLQPISIQPMMIIQKPTHVVGDCRRHRAKSSKEHETSEPRQECTGTVQSVSTASSSSLTSQTPTTITSSQTTSVMPREAPGSSVSVLTPPSSSQVHESSTTRLTSDEVDELSRKLYIMGFRCDEKVLRRTIRAKQGNINEIIDYLSQMNS